MTSAYTLAGIGGFHVDSQSDVFEVKAAELEGLGEGLGKGGITDRLVQWLSPRDHWVAVFDFQLGKVVDPDVELGSPSAPLKSQFVVLGADRQVELEIEQRVLGQAASFKMSREQVAQELLICLKDFAEQLPLVVAIEDSGEPFVETSTSMVVPVQGIQPPRRGQNRVYVEFQDQTGEGADFEQRVYDAICDRITSRGYEVVSFDEADCLFWTTARVFDSIGQLEILLGLGEITGGAPTNNNIERLTREALDALRDRESWLLVVDVQVGRRLDEATLRATEAKDASGIKSAVLAGSPLVQTTIFVELEQRVVGQATSRGKSREEVAKALIDRVSSGVSSQLPRYRRGESPTGDGPPK